MEKSAKRYSGEFKLMILSLNEEGRSLKSLSREYNVSTVTMQKWKKRSMGLEENSTSKKSNGAMYQELLRKEKEIKELRKEIEENEETIAILKKASAILMKK